MTERRETATGAHRCPAVDITWWLCHSAAAMDALQPDWTPSKANCTRSCTLWGQQPCPDQQQPAGCNSPIAHSRKELLCARCRQQGPHTAGCSPRLLIEQPKPAQHSTAQHRAIGSRRAWHSA
jgi:hypothetical protein